jgi:hypothetical protein
MQTAPMTSITFTDSAAPRSTGIAKPKPGARILLAMLAVVGLCVLASEPARAQPVAWTQRAVSGPSAREAHAMARDAGRGVTVLLFRFDAGR